MALYTIACFSLHISTWGRQSCRQARLLAGLGSCAGHVQQLGSESLLPNLMEVKG